MRELLKSYLRRLTNLSTNNRSLLLLRLIQDQFMDLHELDYVLNEPSFNIIQKIIAGKSKIKLVKLMDSRDDFTNRASHTLKQIKRTEKLIFEERGSRDLYVGWPFVRGKFSDNSLISCPLIFFPVDLELESNFWYLKLRKDINITFNRSFLLAFSYYNNIPLDENLIDYIFDDIDQDSRIFRTELYQLLKESPVEINFNQENFLDKLNIFSQFKKKEFEETFKTGELKLYPEAVLGIFPQAGSYLVPDYINLINENKFQDLEEFFHNRTLEDDQENTQRSKSYNYFLNKIKEEKLYTPFELDAYQENAIKAIKRGNSIVVQGPPGTGKSQLISNLICDSLAEGKKVLLVCQKKAALDVVYRRLEEKEMAAFAALVHDFKNDKKLVYRKINHQIEKIQEYRVRNNSLDAIHLERRYLQVSRRIDQITEEFEDFKSALFDESESGISVKELYLTSDYRQPAINLKQEYKFFNFERVHDFIPFLKTYTAYAKKFNSERHPWFNRLSFKDFSLSDLQKISEIIERIPAFQQKIRKGTNSIIHSNLHLEEAEQILSKEEKIKELLRHLNDHKVFEYFTYLINFKDQDTDYLWLGTMERVIAECFKEPGPEITLTKSELGNFQETLSRGMRARRNIFKFFRWNFFSKEKQQIRKVLENNNLQSNNKGFKVLREKIDNRLNLEHNITKLKNYISLKDIPENYGKEEFSNWFSAQKKAVLAKLIFSSLRNFKEYFPVRQIGVKEFQDRLGKLLIVLRDIPAEKKIWQQYLTASQIYYLLEEPDSKDRLLDSLREDFDSLCDFDNLNDKLKSHEKAVINRLFEFAEDYNEDKIESIFQNSIRLAWIEHIETKFPVLRSISSFKFERLEEELQENVKEKFRLSNEIILLKTRERTYKHLEYNRLNNLVTYRDLQHQVNKKKKLWPLRKMIAQFYHELFDLIPCWMASPESVSAIFPMDMIFDVVIFDEASQCFAEKGIPAMYRGRQVMIAGDDKQLSPFDLYKVRYEEEEEEDPLLEIDSLLELGKKYLMQVQLNGHYRSRSIDLIDFSNSHFYDGNLKLIPNRHIYNRNEPAIHYIKVNGTWENQVNHEEAVKVVELVQELSANHPDYQIGIVTFNVKQQGYIIDLLEGNDQPWPEGLIVKNIENVQGDEKDIIIFSTAYAPDPKGRMNMQFGSLNAIKGENRLNVAVTRARHKIYLITSIWPDQLKVDNTKNEGPKLLKAYLQYSKQVSDRKFKPVLSGNDAHDADWYLKNKIQEIIDGELGIETKADVPFADLSLQKDQKYKGLILTDDNFYHQSVSIKEAHAYRPFSFNRLDWPHRTFYSREFWHDKEVIKERIVRFIRNLED